jgi:trk system potassium uptake protein TrkA
MAVCGASDRYVRVNVVIMGCGRVGSAVAARLDREGHDVTVLDLNETSFRRLPSTFGGQKLVGSGTDHADLNTAGLREADAFLALSPGDNRNILAAQLAKHIFGVENVVARLYDPFRGEIFARLGIRTFSPTLVGADLAYNELMRAAEAAPPGGREATHGAGR